MEKTSPLDYTSLRFTHFVVQQPNKCYYEFADAPHVHSLTSMSEYMSDAEYLFFVNLHVPVCTLYLHQQLQSISKIFIGYFALFTTFFPAFFPPCSNPLNPRMSSSSSSSTNHFTNISFRSLSQSAATPVNPCIENKHLHMKIADSISCLHGTREHCGYGFCNHSIAQRPRTFSYALWAT
jgi:hypothetical protein